MKKLTISVMLLISSITFSKDTFKVVDTEFIIKNYYKSQKYNKELKKIYTELSKKYNKNILTLDISEIKNKKLKKEIEEAEKIREKYFYEINEDLTVAIFLNFPNETIFPKEIILNGNIENISEKILKFLNDLYVPLINYKKERKKLNDYIAN